MENIFSKLQELNLSTFKAINQCFGKASFDKIAIFCDKFGGPHVFHYHFLFIIVIAAIMLYHKKDAKSDLKELVILGTSSTITLFFSIIISLVLITDFLKGYIATTRPYCSLENIYIIQEITDKTSCMRGFPSGHMAFSIIMIASFWPLLNRFFKSLAIGVIILIGITRISSGAHYPIDIIAAILLSLPITIFIRNNTEKLIRKYENRWEVFDYLYNKIAK